MTDFETILRKRKPKGADVGRLYMANLCIGYYNASSAGMAKRDYPVDPEKLQKMIASLTDPTEIEIYRNYGAIQDWLTTTLPLAEAQRLQAEATFNLLYEMVTNAYRAEDVYKYIQELPLIMTERQYLEFKEKRTEEILHPDGEPQLNNVFQLIFNALDHYVNLWIENKEAPNPLKPLKEKLESETVQDPHILDKYNEAMGFGYYTLEDGTRSDEVTPNEWKKLVNPVIESLFDDDNGMSKEEKKALGQAIVFKRVLATAKIMYEKGLPEREASLVMQNLEDKENHVKPLEWHYYTDKPEITKWEAVIEPDLFEFYPYYDVSETEAIEMYEAFNKEFPEVVQALLKDIGEKYPDMKGIISSDISGKYPNLEKNGVSGLQELPVKEWGKVCYSWDELHKADFYGFQKIYTADTAMFEGNRRAIMNGIAILRPSDLLNKSPRIDENGSYKAPEKELWSAILPFSLEKFFPDNEHFNSSVSQLKGSRIKVFSSLYFVQGFNKILDLISKIHKVDEVELFKLPIDNTLAKIEALNNSVYMLYKRIKETDYEDEELKEKKLKALQEYFKPMNIEAIEPPKANIANAKKHIKDFSGFKDQSLDPYLDLCIYDLNNIERTPDNWETPRKGAVNG